MVMTGTQAAVDAGVTAAAQAQPALPAQVAPAGRPAPARGAVPAARPVVSVIIPVYNEENLIGEVLRRVMQVPISKEVIVVDDGSTDGTLSAVEKERRETGDLIRVHQAMVNMGKGTAIRIGLKYATGDIVLIQDADMEYDPADYPKLLEPILSGRADVVYGNRFHRKIHGMATRYWLANRILATAATLLFGKRIYDEATAYKAFRREVILGLDLHCSRFEFCPEVTAKALRAGHRLEQVPIWYAPRTAAQGKKIKWRDGFHALWTLVWFRFMR
jgi:dolichol-phosphate mannosyltransferase